MDTFRSAIHTALNNSLTVQKEMTSLTESQLTLASKQVASGFDAWRSAVAATQNANQAMARVYVDAFKVEAKAETKAA